jgi:type I restriction enzyme R subunit
MAYNEDTRVKIPAILHLMSLGYEYLSLKNQNYDQETNIFTDIFINSLSKLNPDTDISDITRELNRISLDLENEDLGREFYNNLITPSGIKYIDFDNPKNNSFHIVTELTYKKDEDEFRPDITLLINGMPLVFIEVKKPNNHEGVVAERNRMNIRCQNKQFRKFINLTQLQIFSNNMEYQEEANNLLQGAFYATSSYTEFNFNSFREEEIFDYTSIIKPLTEDQENLVLKDTNHPAIKNSPEFITNRNKETPTNRILTSLCSPARLLWILKYAFAYIEPEIGGLQKHIMRYPQIFASKAIVQQLDQGLQKGIIWHTQGSGKTALAYYSVKVISDYYKKYNIVPKFYFIVDRLDLLTQAKREFTSRGLKVHIIQTREKLIQDYQLQQATRSADGIPEITVVNIQKFSEDSSILNNLDYSINIQRIYFLDEVHRSYNPRGSFLANLMTSDTKAIKIGLTGTPLIGKNRNSTNIFGNYIHKYYYNSSIRDGYTLRLIREGIDAEYRIKLEEIIRSIEIQKGTVKREQIYSHPNFAKPMLEYIIKDFQTSRKYHGDNTIGAMVVCDSSEQAKVFYDIFQAQYASELSSALILHDIGSKEERKTQVENYKAGKIDILFVYNMLLTGFDAPRLKKLYLGRMVKEHNLLQTLTRVNRPYKNFRYGFVVDFVDIRQEFEATNKAYFEELQQELGDEIQYYKDMFVSPEEVEQQLNQANDVLITYDTQNAEIFSQQISQIEDHKEVLSIKKALENLTNLYNIARLYGQTEILEKIDFLQIRRLYNEISHRLELLKLKEAMESKVDNQNLINEAMENIYLTFRKVSEEELQISDQLHDTMKKTREALQVNFDQKDPEFISLYEELQKIFQRKKMNEMTQEDMQYNIEHLDNIYHKITEVNRRNNLLKAKYESDEKYARIHKRLTQDNRFTDKRQAQIIQALLNIKHQTDHIVLNNQAVIEKEEYFKDTMMPILIQAFQTEKLPLDSIAAKDINTWITKEYLQEYNGHHLW